MIPVPLTLEDRALWVLLMNLEVYVWMEGLPYLA